MAADLADFESIAKHCIALVAAARRLPVDQVTLDSSLEALEVDSLDKVSLSFDLEDAYDIEIPDSALFKVKTVGDMARGVSVAISLRATQGAACVKSAADLESEAKPPDDSVTPVSEPRT